MSCDRANDVSGGSESAGAYELGNVSVCEVIEYAGYYAGDVVCLGDEIYDVSCKYYGWAYVYGIVKDE